VKTPDSSHRDGLENSNSCGFGNIQTLAWVFLPVAHAHDAEVHPDVQQIGTDDLRGKKDAAESHSIQKRQVAAIPDRNSIGRAITDCGGRIGLGCLFAPRDCSRSGISMVLVAGRLPLLLLQDARAVSVDSIGHRRLRLESAFAFPEQSRAIPARALSVQSVVELGE
jgi:hypothetical protein